MIQSRNLLLICWVSVLSSLRQGQAFAPRIGRLFGGGNVNRVGAPTMPEQAAAPAIASSPPLTMVGGVLEEFDPLSETTIPSVVATPESSKLSPLEVWCLVKIEKWYRIALNRRCPFLRRRMTDFVDTLEMLTRMIVIQRQNMDLAGPEVSLRGDERTKHKIMHLSMDALAAIIRRDWKEDSQKGYYITGRLTPAIYRDDCFFDGPDPDMPVRGLRKFLNAASQLFDPKESVCELLSLEVQGDVVVADWKMNGVLRLPWRPRMPEVQGRTTYHFDENGLIHRHEETWDLSAMDAFLKTAWFDFQFKAANTHNEELQEAEVYE